MGIAEEDVAAVRTATDLVGLIGEHVALRPSGARWVGLCPFHAEKTASFYVSPAFGRYHCFGCSASGDAIDFLRAVDHLDFVEAVERLAERAGISLRQSPAGGLRRAKRSELIAVMERAVEWYHQRLVSGADGRPARVYLESRGYGPDTVERFQLGWAPEGWDGLTKALGLSDTVLRDTGLGFLNKLGRRQDSFRARLMFPIFDTAGKPVAFGGRVLPGAPAGEPKYKNSAESAIYSKRKVLYGLNWAKDEVSRSGEVVVCEGYTDVIALFGAGVPRAVATCGTALAEEHFGILRNFARRVVLAYDADGAGQAAAERFYEWERRQEVEIAVAALPAGADPAELGQRDPEALRAAVEGARTFLSFRVERILAAGDLGSVEGRARTAEAALAAVAEHSDLLVRDQYVMRIGAACRIEADQLREALSRIRRRARATGTGHDERTAPGNESLRSRQGAGALGPAGSARGQSGSQRRPAESGSARLELECLRIALHRPDQVAGRLEECCFADPIHRAAFRALRSAPTPSDAITHAAPPVGQLLARLALEEADADPAVELPRLVGVTARRVLNELGALIKAEPSRHAEFSPTMTWLRQGIEALNDQTTADDAAGQLLAWMGGMAPGAAVSRE